MRTTLHSLLLFLIFNTPLKAQRAISAYGGINISASTSALNKNFRAYYPVHAIKLLPGFELGISLIKKRDSSKFHYQTNLGYANQSFFTSYGDGVSYSKVTYNLQQFYFTRMAFLRVLNTPKHKLYTGIGLSINSFFNNKYSGDYYREDRRTYIDTSGKTVEYFSSKSWQINNKKTNEFARLSMGANFNIKYECTVNNNYAVIVHNSNSIFFNRRQLFMRSHSLTVGISKTIGNKNGKFFKPISGVTNGNSISIYAGINTNRAFANPLQFTNTSHNKQGFNIGFLHSQKIDSATYFQLGVEYSYTPVLLSVSGGKSAYVNIEAKYTMHKLNINPMLFKPIVNTLKHKFYAGVGLAINYAMYATSNGYGYTYINHGNSSSWVTNGEQSNYLRVLHVGVNFGLKYEYMLTTKTALLVYNQNALVSNLSDFFIFSNTLNIGIVKFIGTKK